MVFRVGYSIRAIKETVRKTISFDKIHNVNPKKLEEDMITNLKLHDALQSNEIYHNFCVEVHANKKNESNRTEKGKKSKK
jgi:hypothetical protein